MTGTMQMPADFKYKDVFLQGRPVHDKYSSFYAKHPPMASGRWAKIFSPFDALRGLGEAAASKEILYEYKRCLDAEEQKELNRKIAALKKLTENSRAAKRNTVQVTVTYYVPCSDKNHEAFGYKGTYRKKTGILRKIDSDLKHTIRIDDSVISLDDISEMEYIITGDSAVIPSYDASDIIMSYSK